MPTRPPLSGSTATRGAVDARSCHLICPIREPYGLWAPVAAPATTIVTKTNLTSLIRLSSAPARRRPTPAPMLDCNVAASGRSAISEKDRAGLKLSSTVDTVAPGPRQAPSVGAWAASQRLFGQGWVVGAAVALGLLARLGLVLVSSVW